MKKRILSTTIALTFIFCMALAFPASADTQIYSADKSFTQDGITYTAHVMAESRTNGTCGIFTEVYISETVQTGSVGVQPMMYRSSGALQSAGSWSYMSNTADYFGLFSGAAQTYYTQGYYYALSRLNIFSVSNDGYVMYQTNRTPNFACPSLTRSASIEENVASQYGVNENNMTYGSYANVTSDADAPDLIFAVATNGLEGYIKNTDFNQGTDISLEQVQAGLQFEEKAIPVYEVDGTTVIGEFIIYVPTTV